MLASTQAYRPLSFPRAWVLALSVPQLVGWGSLYYAYALLISPMEADLSMSKLELAGAFSWGLLIEGAMAYPVGRLIDRGKARWVMSTGSLLAALGLWLLAQAYSRWEVYVAWAAMGCAMAMVLYTTSFAVVTRRFPSHYRLAIITLSVLGGLASTLFIPLVAYAVQHVGWRQSLEMLALLQVLLCMPLHVLLLQTRDTPSAPQTGSTGSPTASLAPLLRSVSYLQVAAFVIFMTAVSAALPIHLVSMLRSFQLDESWAVMVPASMGVVQVASRLLLYVVEPRLDVHLSNRFISMLMPLGLLMLLLASVVAPSIAVGCALAFVALFGMGSGMLTIVKGTAMAQYVSQTRAGSLNGATGIPLALARAGAPLTLAALWSETWGYGLGLSVLLMLSMAGVAALWLAQRTHAAHNAPAHSSP